MSFTIRGMTGNDLDFGLVQQAREGWSASRAMLAALLEHDPDGGFVALSGGEPVGLVTTSRFEETGWISNLIVVPEWRSRGVGRALMERGLARLDATGARTLRLDGDPPGIPLYRSLGFVDESESLRFQWTPGGTVPRCAGVEVLELRDLEDLADLDAAAFGDRRERLLSCQLGRAEVARGVRRGGRLVGFILAEETNRGLFAGPCVAEDSRVAALLLQEVMVAAGQRLLRLGVLADNDAAASLLGELGFQPTAPSLRMRRGQDRGRGNPWHYFAIASGAVG